MRVVVGKPLQGLLLLAGLALAACQPSVLRHTTPAAADAAQSLPMPPALTPPILSLPSSDDLPTMSPVHQPRHAPPPDSYVAWIRQHDYRRVQRYSLFLQQHGVQRLPPMHDLLVSARDWQRCAREQYQVPPEALWPRMVTTLKVLDHLQEAQILTEFQITSSYRDPELNSCVGGSLGSKHMHNAAIDLKLLGAQANNAAPTLHQLCDFWLQYGEGYQLGLGLYASGQIHLDTEGYRTWGASYNSSSSLCANRAP